MEVVWLVKPLDIFPINDGSKTANNFSNCTGQGCDSWVPQEHRFLSQYDRGCKVRMTTMFVCGACIVNIKHTMFVHERPMSLRWNF